MARKRDALSGVPELIHPAFAAAALAASASPRHEGTLSTAAGPTYRAEENGTALMLRLDKPGNTWIVAEARYRGADSEALIGVLETFCAAIETLPLREAADHGAIHALARLRGDALARPVTGILTPRSAGAAFVCCERLARAILAQHAAATGDGSTANFWSPGLSSAWRARSDAERIAVLEPIMRKFRAERHLGEDDIWIAGIEKTRRVVIGFGPAADYREKPGSLMRLEVEMRRETGDALELFMSEAKDSNPIRRLAPAEERS